MRNSKALPIWISIYISSSAIITVQYAMDDDKPYYFQIPEEEDYAYRSETEMRADLGRFTNLRRYYDYYTCIDESTLSDLVKKVLH